MRYFYILSSRQAAYYCPVMSKSGKVSKYELLSRLLLKNEDRRPLLIKLGAVESCADGSTGSWAARWWSGSRWQSTETSQAPSTLKEVGTAVATSLLNYMHQTSPADRSSQQARSDARDP